MNDILPMLPAAIRAVAPTVDALTWTDALKEPMRSSGLVTPRRAAAFLGQVAEETGGFTVLEENLHYSAERLCQVWPMRFVIPTSAPAKACAMNPEALANTVYGGHMGNTKQGDGWLFHGRGLIQLTGRSNYQQFADAIGRKVEDMPAYLMTREGACVSALWFWSKAGCTALADAWDIPGITRKVNGGLLNLPRRTALSHAALVALGSTT